MSDPISWRGTRHLLAAILCGVALGAAAADRAPRGGPAQRVPSRGELLYDAHCVECHNQQIHWRAGQLARDWPTLQAQVDRWQRAAQLGWSRADILEVTRYLNDAVYGFPPHPATAARDAIQPRL